MQMKVPDAVRLGDTATLTCDYDLEGAQLYTIKWYHYDEEFYRYVPKEIPPSRVFLMDHLNVDVSITLLWSFYYCARLHIIYGITITAGNAP